MHGKILQSLFLFFFVHISHEYSVFHTIISPYCRLLKFNFLAKKHNNNNSTQCEYIHIETEWIYVYKNCSSCRNIKIYSNKKIQLISIIDDKKIVFHTACFHISHSHFKYYVNPILSFNQSNKRNHMKSGWILIVRIFSLREL